MRVRNRVRATVWDSDGGRYDLTIDNLAPERVREILRFLVASGVHGQVTCGVHSAGDVDVREMVKGVNEDADSKNRGCA